MNQKELSALLSAHAALNWAFGAMEAYEGDYALLDYRGRRAIGCRKKRSRGRPSRCQISLNFWMTVTEISSLELSMTLPGESA